MTLARDELWASGHDESVEVNQRALIDKVLSRYSAEFTVFRELLQNSDDAQSRAVEIWFETQDYIDRRSGKQSGKQLQGEDRILPDLKTTLVHRWTFKNNGMVFRDEDWSRLKKIAEGNPDEEKIGAFGVGFYSLFSVTEEPFVTSGGQWMGFYWKDKKDQLFARRGQLPDSDDPVQVTWTSFEMNLREAAPIPVPFDFTRFLASSITFMAHLSEVNVYFDDKRLTKLTKDYGIPRELGIPKGLQSSSRLGVMNVRGIKSRPLHIKAEIMRWVYSSGTEKAPPPAPKPIKPSGQAGFFASLFTTLSGVATPQRITTPLPAVPAEEIDPFAVDETSVTLSIFSANVDVHLDRKIEAELHRSTKKNPPGKLKYELIYTAKDEYDASKKEDEQQPFATGSIFQGLRADLDGSGSARVFIGHATAQTTGLGGHMAARFIPTVERESIDLVDRNVAIWNRELLYVGGLLARSAYEMELTDIRRLWEGAISARVSAPAPEIQSWLTSRSLHALKFFTFHQSTPSAEVSGLLEAAFYSCAGNNQFSLISTVGVRNASEVRIPDPAFTGFLKQLPVVPADVLTGANLMITSLQNRGMIKPITFDDVLKELRSRPLTEDEMTACLKWWIDINKQGDVSHLLSVRTQLLNAAVLIIGEPGSYDVKIISLASITTFISTKGVGVHIPLDGPLPPHLLPISVSSKFTPESLLSSFPWAELTIIDWLRHVCHPVHHPGLGAPDVERDINLSPPWAERVLTVLVRAWPSLSNTVKGEIASLLKDKTCIPTSAGMKIPEQSYFANANVFRDLPIVTFPSRIPVKGPLERLLQSLGVRKHVDLQVVFNRMIKTGDWTIADLTKYLVAVQSTLTEEEWARLKMTAAFAKEPNLNDISFIDGQKPTRYKAEQLYEPLDIFRQLGLPIIDWGSQTKWRGTSDEAKFLFELGLLRFPPLSALIGLCADPSPSIRHIALKYLCDNINSRYKDYDPMNFADIAFIPALSGSTTRLGTPKEVFLNPEWASLKFLVVHPNIQQDASAKLRIRPHPPSSQLVAFLETTQPKDESEARKWFGLLAGRISDFSSEELIRLSQLPIVPTKATGRKGETLPLRWLPPVRCFFGGDSKARFHSKLFVFVDFGTPANGFLSACGTKHEPSVEEITEMLLADPHKFYDLADGPNNFLTELRNIAVNSRLLSSRTLNKMKKSPILLGSRRKLQNSGDKATSSGDFDDDEWDLQYDLRRPEQIVIADDTNAHQFFGDSLFTAPQEDILEGFYADLGSQRLSSLVKEDYKTSVEIKNSKISSETRALILERLPLFLYEHTHARTKVSYSWLNSETNFVVKTFGKLSVTKTLNHGDVRLSRSQDASAVAKRIGSGAIQLSLAGNAQVDMYEVATSLCRLLFDSPKANDALLFMTILSTDLRSLKRRGYNVDRILKQQKAEREAAEDARTKAENTALLSKPQQSIPNHSAPQEPEHLLPPLPSVPMSASAHQSPPEASPPRVDNPLPKPRPASTVTNSFQTFKRKIGSTIHPTPPDKLQPPVNGPSAIDNSSTKNAPPPIPAITRPNVQRSDKPTVTPLSNISSNIEMAIKACRPEQENLLRNREEMQQVKESLNEGYCDISGRAGDLDHVGEMGSVKVFVSRDVPQPQTFMTRKRDSLARFIHIMSPLAKVYNLPLTSLHVFYDLAGDLIAFNRNASIFLNLRYFEEWHDEGVRKGTVNPAYISWYFTLAHEIAHNLVQPHNSEHEFYFSAICEKHIIGLGKLLSVT